MSAELPGRMVARSKVVDRDRISGVRDEPFAMVVACQVAGGAIAAPWAFHGG